MKTDEAAIRRQSALFLLKMKKRFLSQAAVDDIVKDSCAIFTRTFEMVKAGVREKLAETGVDSSIVNLDDVFKGLANRSFC